MDLGLKYCWEIGADLLIATDPGCDRLGIAVREGKDYRLLFANETGVLLLDFCLFAENRGRYDTRASDTC